MARNGTVRQREIIIAARTVIFSKGIENLTVREIAKELKITNAALYKHFKSKYEIISLLIDDIEENLLSAIHAAADKTGDSLQKLESIFYSHLSYSEQMKGTSFTVINQVSGLRDSHLKRKMFGVLNKYLKTIKGIVIHGMESGVFKKDLDPNSASVLFFGALQSMVTLWCLSGYKLSLRILNRCWIFIKAGLRLIKDSSPAPKINPKRTPSLGFMTSPPRRLVRVFIFGNFYEKKIKRRNDTLY